MSSILSANKKVVFISAFAILTLVITNTLLSLFLRMNYSHILDACEGSEMLIHFHPTMNKNGSFLNMKLDLKYEKMAFFMTIVICGIISWLCFMYLLYLKSIYQTTGVLLTPAVFLLAGCFGRLAERIFWNYTFDFIAIKKLGILDLVDVYFFAACFSMIVVAAIIQHFENCRTKDMSKKDRREFIAGINNAFLAMLVIRKKKDKG